MEFPSKVIEQAVNELSKLPGVGKKTALRLAMHLLRRPAEDADALGQALISLRRDIRYCRECGNISDADTCGICINPKRDRSIICVVEDCKDVIALENTHQYRGLYHVTNGLIDPLNGIGPSQLNVDALLDRAAADDIKEVIFAFSATIEGDTTAFYISKKLKNSNISVSSIARGIPVGSDLEFTDEMTLARSLLNRTSFTVNQD